MDITVTPGIEYPIQSGFTLLDLGGAMDMRASVPLPFLPWLAVSADISYSYLPTLAASSLSLISAGAGVRATWEATPRFSLYGSVSFGGYYGFLNSTALDATGVAYQDQQGGDPFVGVGGGFTFYLAPSISMGVDTALLWYVGLNLGLRATVGASFHLDGLARKVSTEDIQFTDLFPSLYKLYEKKTPGSAVLENHERFPITNINVTVFAQDYMETPTKCSAPDKLDPGKSAPLELGMLLSDRVLDLKEAVRTSAELRVEYTLNGRRETAVSYGSLSIQNRNAMIWNDDRKVAAFVTPTDPEVLGFSKLAAGMVRDVGPAAMNQNLRMAMGMFTALSYYGMKYVVDPTSPSYKDASNNPQVIDFLQFPRQTLSYKGGDCDDLSILACSLLESVGVETAFITVPGHIFLAASLGISPEEAQAAFTIPNDLIFKNGKAWLPLEITMLGSRFIQAWQAGAREWRQSADAGTANFYPTQECWTAYEMSGAPTDAVALTYPVLAQLRAAYDNDMGALVDSEIGIAVRDLTAQIVSVSKPTKERNKLGVLYARYGRMKDAEVQFLAALKLEEYVPAMLNLGTIYYSQGNFAAALAVLHRAEKASPANSAVLVSLARVNYELADSAEVDKYVARAEMSAPGATERFPYLRQQVVANGTARAADAQSRRENLVWAVDQ